MKDLNKMISIISFTDKIILILWNIFFKYFIHSQTYIYIYIYTQIAIISVVWHPSLNMDHSSDN